MAEIILDTGMRGDIKLQRSLGHVWGEFTIKELTIEGASAASTQFDVYLGCLKTNWNLTMTPETEEIPFSCTNGKFTIDTDKNYTVSVGTKNMPFALRSALMGLNTFKDAATGETVMKQVKKTCSYTLSGSLIALDTEFVDCTTAAQIKKIVSVYNKTSGEFWYLGSTADNDDRTFTLDLAADDPDLIFEAAAATDGAEFVVTLQYTVDMAEGDWKAIEDGETFAEESNLILSWLVKVESGPDKGNSGYIIADIKHAKCTSPIVLGGDTKGIEESDLEFSVNFQDSGDITLHFIALS